MISYRKRLLTSTVTAFIGGVAIIAPHAASAQCVTAGNTVTCATTTTTDTTNAGLSPADDREYLVDTSTSDFTGTVTAGSLVDGHGLAFTNTVGGTNDLIVVNDGTVQVDVGNTATAGGTAALDITAVGATNVDYSGDGDILNLGTGGDGLRIDTTGTGNIVANVGGNVTSAVGGNGINALNSGASGDITITTAADTLVSADLVGVFAQVTAPASDGAISITNNADIGSLAGPADITHGVAANNFGTGSITIENNGDIGSATDVPTGAGVLGQIINVASTADVTLTNTGDIYVADAAIAGYNSGQGGISIDNSGALTSTTLPGIYAEQAGMGTTGEVVVINSGAIDAGTHGIQTSNAGTGGISITNDGAITAVGMGIRARGLSALQTGDILVEGTGTIDAGDTGIWAATAGTSAVTVDYSGAIDTTGATGVDVDATTGTATVTLGAVTAATNAVDVTSTGDQDITLNGVTTGTAGSGLVSTTTGARTVTVGTGGNVTGGTQAILLAGTGTATVDNSGIIGDDSATLAINAAAAGATGVTNNASGTINGQLTLSAFDDTFGNSGNWNTQGITDFGLGDDALTNNASGIISLSGDTTLANLETFTQNGRINLNTYVLTGPPIAFTNNGTIDTNGNAGLAGFTSFNNAGTLDLAAGTFTAPVGPFTNSGLILADEGASTITGQTSFSNTGTLDLQDGVPNDVLTINSNFVGSGASALLVDFNGSVSDRLVINGAASGTTTVGAAYLGGGFNLDGLLVVDTVSSSANAFVLGAVTGETPLLDVGLVQVGADYFLVAAPTEATFNPLVVPGFATDLWYQSADEVFAETVKPATTVGFSFWGEGYASRARAGDRNDDLTIDGFDFEVNNRLKTKRYGLQGGIDYGFGGARIGLTGGYGWAKANGNAGADLKADGWNLGVYGQFGGLTGFHGEFLLKHDRYNAEFDDGAFDGVDFDIRSTGVDGSLGYRFGMGSANLDLFAGVSHVKTKVDDITAFGFDYDISRLTSTRGRAGVRAVFGGSLAPYISGTVYHEFHKNRSLEFFDGANFYDVDTNGRGTWGRIEAGLSGNDGPGPILAAYGDFGDRSGIGLRAGWRFGGGQVAEALPPPPPPVIAPPPPPPPATQTCADGSVILATDMCPPPPPPPPPLPEPERG